MSAKNNFRFSPMLGHEEQNQCWVLLQADLCVLTFFQNTQQRWKPEKSVKTNEQCKVVNSCSFTVSS